MQFSKRSLAPLVFLALGLPRPAAAQVCDEFISRSVCNVPIPMGSVAGAVTPQYKKGRSSSIGYHDQLRGNGGDHSATSVAISFVLDRRDAGGANPRSERFRYSGTDDAGRPGDSQCAATPRFTSEPGGGNHARTDSGRPDSTPGASGDRTCKDRN